MAKKPGVDIEVKHQRRDPKTGKHYDLEGLVEFAVGGNKLNTDYLRESYMDRSMKGTMKWTEENLKNLILYEKGHPIHYRLLFQQDF